MFIKYREKHNFRWVKSEKLAIPFSDFCDKFEFSDLIPFRRNTNIKFAKGSNTIHVLKLIYNHDIGMRFFADRLLKLDDEFIIFVYNYKHSKDDYSEYLTKNYKGDILNFGTDERKSSKTILQLNKTLIDENSILDWYDIWGHGFKGWIIKRKDFIDFKQLIENIHVDTHLDSIWKLLICKIEFGSMHESIQFISRDSAINDEISKVFIIDK